MGLPANPWKMGAAGTRGAPFEEPSAPEPAMLEPAILELTTLEPAVPEPACPEQLSSVRPSQWEVSTMGIQVVPWAEGPPGEAYSKWSNPEG